MLNKNPHLTSPKGRGIKWKKAMTLIEVMIAIFIFTLWIASVFMIITSAGNINSYNKNFIIASNLAREQIELIRNIRDTNYKKFQKWNLLKPESWNYSLVFGTWSFYKIENWTWVWWFHIKSLTWSIISNFEDKVKNHDTLIDTYKLCLDSGKKYVYCNWDNTLKQTRFYKYIEIKQLKDSSWNDIVDSLKINSKVYWKEKWVHKVEIPTIIANYKRL